MLHSRERFIRALTGRLRIQVFGLKRNRLFAEVIGSKLNLLQGILEASPCVVTGRALITYDARQISIKQIINEIELLEKYLLFGQPCYDQLCTYSKEVSATIEAPQVTRSPVLSFPSWIVTMAADRLGMRAKQFSTETVSKPDEKSLFPRILTFDRSRLLDTSKKTTTVLNKRREINKISAESWHAVTPEELLKRFSTHEHRGLTTEQVLKLSAQYGKNELKHKKPPPWFLSYLGQFKEFTTLVVLGASALALLSGDVVDGLAMGIVLLANAAVGNVQERKAERVIEDLNEFRPPKCKVIRENSQFEIDGNELVPGDIVCLEAGNRVPADLRLLRCWNLEVNESTLTGESLPMAKIEHVVEASCPLPERKNMLFMGTDVTRGKGIGVVVGRGMETEIGYLVSLMKDQEKVVTPLHEKVTRISKRFIKWTALAGGLVFLVGLLRGRPLTQMISTSIILAASAVPEGLPVTITIALSAGIYRMAKKNALIRKLSALETLGRITVICTDKTGTLTKNEMTVKKILTINRSWTVTGDGYEPAGAILEMNSVEPTASEQKLENPELQCIARIGLLCNNSKLEHDGIYWNTKGDPTEGALLTLAGKFGLCPERMTHWHRIHEVPFDSNSGTMSVVCRDTERDQACYVYCKGSVESILEYCQWYQQDGEIHPLTEEKKQSILKQNEVSALEALRVLAFAYSPIEWIDNEAKEIGKELIFVGLTGMMDPPKRNVEKSIREAYALGVQPVIITGDHPITAIAIANELGIGNGNKKVLTGQDLDRLSDEELSSIAENVRIFARVTPEHKLRIVKAYQALGHIVAMTGDGVNDTPAIKQANIGIAMGRTGTEVTKAAADIVLKEDQFGSIIEGVKEGRNIIGNIRKVIGCLFTSNLAEILVTTTAVMVGLPMPLIPLQILLINLIADAIPALILGMTPRNYDNDKQITKPLDIIDTDLYQKVISRGILLAAGTLGLFTMTLAAGAPLAVAQTVAFTTLVIGHYVQTFSWRREGTEESTLQEVTKDSLKDRYLLAGLGVSFLALLTSLYAPPIAGFFHTTQLNFKHWVYILIAAGPATLGSKPILRLLSLNHKKALNSCNQLPILST
ncbi:cation-transporting P-type ATPase [Desulfosporosinus sp. OT]|uniref:cation-translocating P-type ATPase n=1 Tax=Desulfosporosinus sp. OT TaxID=913865 RepID=UPI0002239E26|nr:cation-transporting P-type ATPase [Desulfosporosinus sp. OT]EGW40071.1 calcium-transporting ATPase [Desulfosporosinus sp. OT]